MRLNRKRAAAMLAAAAATTGTMAPASASAKVDPNIVQVVCGTRTDWFRIWAGPSSHSEYCYANAGSKAVNYHTPDKVDTGNNYGVVDWEDTHTGRFYDKILDHHYSVFKWNAGTQFENRLSLISIN